MSNKSCICFANSFMSSGEYLTGFTLITEPLSLSGRGLEVVGLIMPSLFPLMLEIVDKL